MPRRGVQANDGDLSDNKLSIGARCGAEELGAGIKRGGVKCNFMFIYRVTTLKAVVVFDGIYVTYVYDKSKHEISTACSTSSD